MALFSCPDPDCPMRNHVRGILQLDFDGTLAQGDVSTGILARFAGPEWEERVSAASRELLSDPESTALVDTMVAGYAALTGSRANQLRHAREQHPPRPGLRRLIEEAERLGLESHVVSNGFEFYIRDYLRTAGVEARVWIHSGSEVEDGALAYLNPEGAPTRSRFKVAWAEHFLRRHAFLVYVGDGSSDVAPAQLASIVFARDSLLSGMPAAFQGRLRAFETPEDVAKGLDEMLG